MIDQLQEVIDVLTAIGEIANINVLPVTFETGGNGRFIQEFEQAGNKPPVDDDNVSLGVVLYGGAGLSAAFQLLFPFGGF